MFCRNRFDLRSARLCRRVGAAVLVFTWLSGVRADRLVASGTPTHDAPAQTALEPCSEGWLRQGALLAAGPQLVAPDLDLAAAPPPAADHALAEQQAEPADVGIQANTRPNDPLFAMYQRRSRVIGSLQAWETSFGGNDVTIAIIADGVEHTHRDLRNKLWRNPRELPGNGRDDDANGYVDDVSGWDFGTGRAFGKGDNDPRPIPRRDLDAPFAPTGTAMAGIAAAETNNGIGIAGVSWGARIMPLKIHWRASNPLPGGIPNPRLDPDGDGWYWAPSSNFEMLTHAICYAADNGAQVIAIGAVVLYNPVGAGNNLQRTQDAIEYAHRRGVTIVAGAGECGTWQPWCLDKQRYGENVPAYPAAFNRVIGVQSFGPEYQLRPYASFGEWVDLAAPGEDFDTTWRTPPEEEFKTIASTYTTPSEMAAAHVAGVVAVMKSLNPGLGPYQIEELLCGSANRSHAISGPFEEPALGGGLRNDRFGCGVLNFERAVEDMPWQVRVTPAEVVQLVDMTGASTRAVVTSPFLNEGHWKLVSEQPWLSSAPIAQQMGEPSQAAMKVDVAGLQQSQGGLMSGNVVSPVVRVEAANEDNPEMATASTAQTLKYTVKILERIQRAYLPVAMR